MTKGIKIEEGRIDEICKDLKRYKTFDGLRKFLIRELSMTEDNIREGREELTQLRGLAK